MFVHLCRCQACRVLVTGANGYVGRSLLERFAELGADVQGVDLVADPQRGVVAGDITEPGPWCSLLQDRQLVVHAAGVHHGAPDAAQAWHVNVVGTRRLLDAAADHDVPRFVHLSSTGVACFAQAAPDIVDRCNPGQELDEHWPLMPVGEPCADSAMAAEHAVRAADAGGEVSATVIRAADVYGPGNRPWGCWSPSRRSGRGGSCCPKTSRGCSPSSTSTTWWPGSSLRPPARRPKARSSTWGGEVAGDLRRVLRTPGGHAGPTRAVGLGPGPVRGRPGLGARRVARRGAGGRGQDPPGVQRQGACGAGGGWLHVELEEGMARTEAWLRAHGHLPALAVDACF